MMAVIRYLTHPQVQIEPGQQVPLCGLNETGRSRVLRAFFN
jgi:ABC-type branched-subunit amino acid transport system ATPase component